MPLGHGAVYQLGKHSLVPRNLENMDLPQAQECQAFCPREEGYTLSGNFPQGKISQHLELPELSKVTSW